MEPEDHEYRKDHEDKQGSRITRIVEGCECREDPERIM